MSYPKRRDIIHRPRQIPLGERIALERERKRRREKEKENGKRDKSQFVNRDSPET